MARCRWLSALGCLVLLSLIESAFAQEVAPGTVASTAEGAQAHGFGRMVLFWSGAVLLMAAVARIVFREHIHERRTLRLLRDSIGKARSEFDPVQITTWVNLAAPHVWTAWRTGEPGELPAFSTPRFQADIAQYLAELRAHERHHEARLGKVLKTHMLGLYPDGAGPPPKDLVLVLRIETRAVDCIRGADNKVVEGRAGERQVQHFWTLRHDGRRWQLDLIERAEQDRTDLAKKPPVPSLAEWTFDS